MENEVWKDIVGYEGIYQVSNMGRARSLDRWVQGHGKMILVKGGIKKLSKTKKGYLTIGISKNDIVKRCPIHRLVMLAFIGNSENKPEVNHINGDKTDNRLENLEWATCKENIAHAFNTGLRSVKYGKEAPRSIPINQYDKQGNFIKTWDSITEAAKTYKMSTIGSVINCCRNKPHFNTAYGYKWEYAERQGA